MGARSLGALYPLPRRPLAFLRAVQVVGARAKVLARALSTVLRFTHPCPSSCGSWSPSSSIGSLQVDNATTRRGSGHSAHPLRASLVVNHHHVTRVVVRPSLLRTLPTLLSLFNTLKKSRRYSKVLARDQQSRLKKVTKNRPWQRAGRGAGGFRVRERSSHSIFSVITTLFLQHGGWGGARAGRGE